MGDGSSIEPVVNGYHCDPSCPYLQKWDHPFWHHTAWCWRNLVDLSWHDYWIAAFLRGDATDIMEKVRGVGRTKPTNC